ncbi:MAG: hypothetical protein ACRC8S_12970 [Fimbriiglobus sp.]
MAIEMNCPKCSKSYRLKDELLGKKVTCANDKCRTAFVVGVKPGTGPSPTLGAMKATSKSPPPPAPDAEEVARKAFADEVDDTPTETRTIPMTCTECDHQWTEPWDKQGKNTVCPACRVRQKVPVPVTKGGKTDWRVDNKPAGAKRETLEGVASSTDAGYASGESLRQAGLGKPELEPLPLWKKVSVVAAPILLIGLVIFGVMSYSKSRTDNKADDAMKLALNDLPPDDSILPKTEILLFRALLRLQAGEYLARKEKKSKELQEALDHFGKARQDLEGAAVSFGRDQVFQELAISVLALGGTQEEIDAQQRIRWQPQASGSRRVQVNEKIYDVQGELRQIFTAMRSPEKPVSREAREQTLRRVSRELAKLGQPELIERLVPTLFADDEQLEATSIAAYETFKATNDTSRASNSVGTIAGGAGAGRSTPTALLALASQLPEPPATLKVAPFIPGTGPIDDTQRAVYGQVLVLKGSYAEAIDLAKRPGRTDSRLKLLALIAELAPEPAPAVTAASEILTSDGNKKELGTIPDYLLVRLASAAGRANQPAAIEQFVKAIPKDDHRAWARADGLRATLQAGPAKLVDEALAEIPTDAKDYRIGHGWARFWLARNNSAAGETKAADGYDRWGKGSFAPLGLAGQAQGQLDRKR